MDNQRVNMLLTRWYSENQPTLFAKSETDILELCSAIHAPGDDQTSVNVDAIFHDAKAAASDVTERIDSVVKGREFGTPIVPFYTSSFQGRPTLLHYMSIGCRGNIRRSLEPYTIWSLIALSMHSWEAKAVLALSTFAWKYNSMCSNLITILKQVPDSTNPVVVLNCQGRIVMLNNLVKANLQLIDHTLNLKNVRKDIASLDSAMKQIPVYVFWSIISMMACVTESIRLTSFDEKNCYGLNQFSEKINSIIKSLEIVQNEQDVTNLTEETAADSGKKFFNLTLHDNYDIHIISHGVKLTEDLVTNLAKETAADSGKKFFNLIFHDNYDIHIISHGVKLTEDQKPCYIDIEKHLSQRYLFLFITTMQIRESDIDHLKNLKQGKTENTGVNRYKILWIPMIREEWTAEIETKYNNWKSKMDWYCVFYNNAHKKSIKKIKDLGFNYNDSILTVIDPFGEVKEINALQKLRKNEGRIKAFPYLLRKT